MSTICRQFKKKKKKKDKYSLYERNSTILYQRAVVSAACIRHGGNVPSPAGTGRLKCYFAPPTTAAPSTSGPWVPSWPRSTRSGRSSPVRQRSTRFSKYVLLSARQTRYVNRVLFIGKDSQFIASVHGALHNVFITRK